ncbi:type VI secretion protein [Massilia sp. CCM 8694]|uniref:Type VI secretion protein n=1 Tax=Massilia genomosp. 1 TaxID=2609280 RepID=A0ABX0N3P6_9BURK|nr:type VI secretion protein [Massilia genomosp. 1]
MLAISGCAATKSLFQPKIALKQVQFVVDATANDATPFAVDLVAVSDESLVPALLALTAAQWFDPGANIKRDYPDRVHCWSYELTPGMSKPVDDAGFAVRGTRAVLLFANYKGKGAYRLRLDATPKATVRFADKTVRMEGNP